MSQRSLNPGLVQLTSAFSRLGEQWLEVQSHWQDDASRKFEELHLRELPSRLKTFVAATQRLAASIERAERECADREEVL